MTVERRRASHRGDPEGGIGGDGVLDGIFKIDPAAVAPAAN
jgi:hypothetical protein